MTREDAMNGEECSHKSMEFLFRPMNMLELLLRIDF